MMRDENANTLNCAGFLKEEAEEDLLRRKIWVDILTKILPDLLSPPPLPLPVNALKASLLDKWITETLEMPTKMKRLATKMKRLATKMKRLARLSFIILFFQDSTRLSSRRKEKLKSIFDAKSFPWNYHGQMDNRIHIDLSFY